MTGPQLVVQYALHSQPALLLPARHAAVVYVCCISDVTYLNPGIAIGALNDLVRHHLQDRQQKQI